MGKEIKKIVIYKNSKNIDIIISPSGTILDALTLLGNSSLQLMKHCVEEAPNEFKEEIRKDLYDKFNFMASNILEAFDPEAELHPGVSEKAWLELENKIIDEEYKKIKKKK